MVKPRLRSGKVVTTADQVEFHRTASVSQFPISSAPYLEAFVAGICIHDIIRARFEKGENVNFAAIKETLSTLYWNGDLENEAAFQSFIEVFDGPPEKAGYLSEPFVEFGISTADATSQFAAYAVCVSILAATFLHWMGPEASLISAILIPQSFFTLKTLVITIVDALLGLRTQALSLHVSAFGIYLAPSNGRPHEISESEFLLRAISTLGLAGLGYQFLQSFPEGLFQQLGFLFLVVASFVGFSPTHNSDLSNYRRFSLRKNRLNALGKLMTGAYFVVGAAFVFAVMKLASDVLAGGFPANNDVRLLYLALSLWGLGAFLDQLDDYASLNEFSMKFLPRRMRFRDALTTTAKVDVLTTLQRVPMLDTMPPEVLKQMTRYTRFRSFNVGERIIREGDTSDELYIIIQGQVGVYTKRSKGGRECAAQLAEGSMFGEAGFFLKRPRVGHIYALVPTVVLQVKRPPNIDLSQKLTGDDFALLQRKIWSFQTLAASELFKDTPVELLREMVQKGQLVDLAEKQVVFDKGDAADALWVIVQGRCQAIIDGKSVREMNAGDIFGEIGVLRKSKRTARIMTADPSVLLRVSTNNLWDVLSCNLNLGLTIQNVARERFFSQAS